MTKRQLLRNPLKAAKEREGGPSCSDPAFGKELGNQFQTSGHFRSGATMVRGVWFLADRSRKPSGVVVEHAGH